MFDAGRFARLRAGALLVNIGRGGTVDEAAMCRALDEGRLAGAALDVFADEPLPEDSPLWAQRGLLITSHYAGLTPRYLERATELLLDNLRRYLDGESLRNVVDKNLGY
jgi:phosphoglycerate dehydrogenase-like enzyme